MSPCGERKNPSSCDGEYWWGSNYGTEQDVVAPGVLVSTTDRQGSLGYNTNGIENYGNTDYTNAFNGTSSACPHVAGVVALILSLNSTLTAQEVNDIIEQSARKVRTDLYNYATTGTRPNGTWNNEMGYGLVDAFEAVKLAQACSNFLSLSGTVSNVQNFEDCCKIISTQTLTATSDVDYKAGYRIFLMPGFTAAQGSNFHAFTYNCTSANVPTASDPVTYSNPDSYYTDPDGGIPTLDDSSPKDKVISNNGLRCYPNPFSAQTTLEYTVRHDSPVTLTITDLTGRQVAQWVNQERIAGTHRIDFNAQDLPAGLYLARLQAGNQVSTIKMTVF